MLFIIYLHIFFDYNRQTLLSHKTKTNCFPQFHCGGLAAVCQFMENYQFIIKKFSVSDMEIFHYSSLVTSNKYIVTISTDVNNASIYFSVGFQIKYIKSCNQEMQSKFFWCFDQIQSTECLIGVFWEVNIFIWNYIFHLFLIPRA